MIPEEVATSKKTVEKLFEVDNEISKEKKFSTSPNELLQEYVKRALRLTSSQIASISLTHFARREMIKCGSNVTLTSFWVKEIFKFSDTNIERIGETEAKFRQAIWTTIISTPKVTIVTKKRKVISILGISTKLGRF